MAGLVPAMTGKAAVRVIGTSMTKRGRDYTKARDGGYEVQNSEYPPSITNVSPVWYRDAELIR
jgi:hypothetical protein